MDQQTDTQTFVPKRGDLVQLKSGGPTMTVEARAEDYQRGPQPFNVDMNKVDTLCIWFTPAGEFTSHWFPDAVLKAADQ